MNINIPINYTNEIIKNSNLFVNRTKKYNTNEKIVSYVLRYTGRPVMAESRILDFNPRTKKITYFYEPHEDDGIEEKNKASSFIYRFPN